MTSKEGYSGGQKRLSASSALSDGSTSKAGYQDSWEIVEGLKEVHGTIQEPQKQEGFLLKRRKWPMKGWHKRYFMLDKGIMKYAKTEANVSKGKLHGSIDVGLSVMSIKKNALFIDLDTEASLYHLKVTSQELFDEWVAKLRHHRLYRQNEISMFPQEVPTVFPHRQSVGSIKLSSLSKQASVRKAKVNAWLQSTEDMDQCHRDLEACEGSLSELNLLLKNMEILHRTHSAPSFSSLQAALGTSPKKEKKGVKIWRSKGHGKESSTSLQVPTSSKTPFHHTSFPNLSSTEAVIPESGPESPDSPSDIVRLQEDFCRLAGTVHSKLKSAFDMLTSERERLRLTLNLHAPPSTHGLGPRTSDSVDGSHSRLLIHQTSNVSLLDSSLEFYDAHEYLVSASSSEASDDADSSISDLSDAISTETFTIEAESGRLDSECGESGSPRRSALPAQSPCSSDISLWSILKNNIGKDLSKVAMPVQLNEPLNTLQRLCEELEYSELLSTANATPDSYERMVYVATFAVSAYASTFNRAGSKPFNPVLGETYECDRPDKDFRFIAEQVSHHPPVSACHCDSKNFTYWQDVRWKNKFWGKSMEIVPIGTTHVVLPRFGDHYEWNKVTSCVHNIISGQRWIEHYGEMLIRNTGSAACQCKITFVKARTWNSVVNEIEGVVTDSDGHVVQSLFGKWHEAVYSGAPPTATCVWRANPMPVEHEQYYGFTQFAVELNELSPVLRPLLPLTDTRFRMDQRCLEEGRVEEAEEQKQRIEQLQRERRRVLEENHMSHTPRFFTKSKDDTWVSNHTYWSLRKDPGFGKLDCPVLW